MASFELLVLAVIFLCYQSCHCMPNVLHASCKIDWTFSVSCNEVHDGIVSMIRKWTSPDNCQDGGEKCLYKLISDTPTLVKAIHETPKKHYKDDLSFAFKAGSGNSGCDVHGYSTSETWYAVLDSGTNYCNLHNLILGAGLDKDPSYQENTSNSQCTQYSTANCDVY